MYDNQTRNYRRKNMQNQLDNNRKMLYGKCNQQYTGSK